MKTTQFRLLVVRTTNIKQVLGFYESLGLDFCEHRHGTGPMHFATELSGLVFEIYPTKKQANVDRMTRLGFALPDLPSVVDLLRSHAIPIVEEPTPSEWGMRAIVNDPDGRVVELYAVESNE